VLTRLWSPAFRRNGKPRPVIALHAGLNIVEGADQAQNSIGKSTLLQIIDFVYAGKDFLDSDAVRLPQAVGHHAVHFTLRLNGQDHHFVRATDRPGFVTRYHDPDWQEVDRDYELAEYQQFLLDEYGLGYTGGTWRELVGRFSRVDERDMALLDRPLAAAARANDIDGAKALLRLFGAYEEIDKIQSHYDQVRKEVDALNAMAKGKYSSYIKFTTKKECDAARKELLEARSEAKQLRTHADLDLFETERQARYEQAQRRAELQPLTLQLDAINSRLAIVEATLSGQTRITTRDLEEFYEFFPNANRESLETIEYYHHQLTGILEDQLREQQRHYQAQAAELKVAIHNLQAQILALGESVQLDDEIYDQSAEIQAKINRLEEQIRTFDHNQELKKERKQLKQEIDEAIPNTLGHLTDTINAQMKTVNDALYPQQHRKSPLFTFKAATKGVSYTFDHNGDTGSGAKAKNLIVFDLAVMRSTPLPFLIHDSAIIKPVAFAPVRELLSVYASSGTLKSGAGEPKQVFFSFDATKAYGTGAEEIVAENQIIHLGENNEALYGFTWNLETDQHEAGDNQS
jgi:possible chromosome segregation ATPase